MVPSFEGSGARTGDPSVEGSTARRWRLQRDRGEGSKAAAPGRPKTSTGRAACRSSGVPGFAAGVPADKAVTGDEVGDALEENAVFLGCVADSELGDPLALPRHRDRRYLCAVLLPCVRAELELPFLDEGEADPRVAGTGVESVDDAAQDIVGIASLVDDPLDLCERVTARHRRPRKP